MAAPKTRLTGTPVAKFFAQIEDEERRSDCQAIAKMMSEATGAEGEMWGPAIVGFGRRPLVYPNGKQIAWMVVGFSPRKQNLVLYILGEDDDALLEKLGPHSRGKGCLYLKRLSDVNLTAQ
jgi:hypothetical protein